MCIRKSFHAKELKFFQQHVNLKVSLTAGKKSIHTERGNNKSNVETDSPTTFHWTLLPQNEIIHILLDLHSKTFDIRVGELRVSRYV